MKKLIFSIFLLIGFSTFVFSQQTENKKDEKEITVCPIKLLVGAADFRFSYRYIIKTNDKGIVSEFNQLGKDNPKFIDDEIFKPCIESWKLSPSEDYFVSINVGTIFNDRYKNFIFISNKKETMKIIIPDTSIQLITSDKKNQ